MATKKNQRPNQGSQAQGRMTKAERKDQARQERQVILQQMARRKRNGRILVGAAVVVAIGAGALLLTQSGSSITSTTLTPSTPPTVSGILPGMITSTDTSTWTNNTTDLAQRLAMLQLGPSGAVLHIHAHLDLYVNGQPFTVPADIGLSNTAESPLHVHEGETGVIHIESGSPNAQFTLGNFFDVWGLKLTSTCLGGFCNGNGSTLTAYVNGRPWNGDPRTIPLTPHEEVFLAFGTKSQLPSQIPSSFDFSQYGL